MDGSKEQAKEENPKQKMGQITREGHPDRNFEEGQTNMGEGSDRMKISPALGKDRVGGEKRV